MKFVQPIRDKNVLNDFKKELLKISYRDYMLFTIGINTGLRIGDLLSLKVEDVRARTHIIITEQKTGKYKRFLINDMLRIEINKYIEGMRQEEYLFKSKKTDKPISRVQAYRILNKVADKLGIEEIGCHSMRKAFGYFHYQQYKDVAILQSIFNHSSPSITLRYIGIMDDNKDETIKDFYI
ncbi:site-specific integrase [Terrisporobacter mayombei]|uniref:site-specific integrase n=1 Tax=Terrisporobacter sp. TaxID=1965305 RepID=UPI00165122FD|nr:site-specific integrase [Terrisporobacter sp.]MBC6695233.1 site-specific integrase [Terrisporobacter mayombei]